MNNRFFLITKLILIAGLVFVAIFFEGLRVPAVVILIIVALISPGGDDPKRKTWPSN